jgi:hypothetical protein
MSFFEPPATTRRFGKRGKDIAMKRLVFFITFSLPAQISNVSVSGVTNTQAVLQYTAPDMTACTVEVSTSATYIPLIHDVDPAIFAGSNLDNRPGSISGNVTRTFVAGTRDAEQGVNGHWYSRALQALTPHYYRITCGTYTATGSFTTDNIALGNTYNETLPPAPSVTSSGIYYYAGQYAWPEFLNWNTADPTARQEAVIDPQTGMALKRMTMPQDWGSANDHLFKLATAPTGAWTNPNNILADDSAYTSYSGTTSDWLVLIDPALTFPNNGNLESFTFSAKAWCSGACAGEDAKIQVCLTQNGVTCWPTASNVNEVTLGTSALPASFTSFGGGAASLFAWTPPGIPPLVSWDAMQRSGQVNVDASGNVTWTGSGNQFYPGWTAGSKITIAGSVCAISSLNNPQLLAIAPASCSPSLTLPQANAAYSAGNFGVMIRKKTSSTDTINVQYAKYTVGSSAALQWPSGGAPKICSYTATQNTVTGHMGYHCVVGNTPQVYWIDSTTGDANWLGPLYTGSHGGADGWSNQACNASSVTLSGTNPTNPETYYCPANDGNGKPIILGCTLTTTNQTGSASYSCQNLTPASAGKDYLSLVTSFTSGYTPLFDPVQYGSIGMVGMQKGQLLLTSFRGFQDTAAWVSVFNPTLVGSGPGCVGGGLPGCVVAAQSTWGGSAGPCRWCTLHNAAYSGESNSWVLTAKYFGGAVGLPGGGFYTSTVSSPMRATPSIASGTSGCPSGSRGCDLVTVDGEPCNMAPAGPVGGHPADPLNCPKNSAWSYLQDAAPGDVFGTATGPLEYLKLISKNGNQWLLQRGVGSPGLVTPQTPIQLVEECLDRDDGFNYGVSTLQWVWDFASDPHAQNASGTTVRVEYPYDHQSVSANAVVGGGPWYDPKGLGYSILDGSGYGYPNKYSKMGPFFAGTVGLASYNEIAQEHPSLSQFNAPTAEQQWFLDARPLSGPGPTAADQATPVSGQLYKFGSTTSDGDNLTYVGGSSAQAGAVNRKIQATMMFCGTQPMIDVSSAIQGNTIGTGASNAYQYCVARKGGECRSGSSMGDVYANCPLVNPRRAYGGTYGCNNIFAESGLGNDLCINNTGAYLNGVVQIGFQNSYDATGAAGRLLTHGMIRYRLNDVNENVRTTPDGAWLLFEGEDFNGSEYQILSGKMLPYPAVDTINRTTFVPMMLQLKPQDGLGVDNAIVQFGYAENGGANQFYCTSRHEACLVASPTVGSVPFRFPSDSPDGTSGGLTGAPCSSGCSVAIPALSQRVVYYQVQYRDSSNHVVAQTRFQAVATP